MAPRISVMLSSTMADQKPERDSLKNAIDGLPIYKALRFEDLCPQWESPETVSLRLVKDGHVYLSVLKERYGDPIPNNPGGLSATHREYEEAKALGRPTLFYILENPSFRDAKLRDFVKQVMNFHDGHTVGIYETKRQLIEKAVTSLWNWSPNLEAYFKATFPNDFEELKRIRDAFPIEPYLKSLAAEYDIFKLPFFQMKLGESDDE